MSFLLPHMMWLALAAPALILAERLLGRARRGRRTDAEAFAQIRRGVSSGGRVRFGDGALRTQRPRWRLWVAFLLIVVALARPQWGRVEEAAGADAPGEVMIALDLSRSMLAKDVAPSRLERARALAARLAEELPDRRVGLIGFAGSAYLLAPASEDRAVLRAYLPRMRPEHMPEPGTDFAALVEVAVAAFSPVEQGRTLVVLSDGEAEPGAWESRLAALQGRDVRIITVGIGTEGGASVPGPPGKPLLSPAGAPVVSRLNPATLQAMASATGGRYLDLSHARELPTLVRTASARPSASGRQAADGRTVRADQFAWFVGAALILLAWSALTEFTARPRLRRRPMAAVAQTAVAAILVVALLPPASRAAKPILTETDLQGEKDPLEHMKEVVAAVVAKREFGAADYRQVAEVAVRYGEIHRSHGHGLQDGVLRDGLAAVDAGRRLDSGAADWAGLTAKLKRLLEPPPLVPPDPGPADPANEPTGAQGQAPVPGEDARDSSGDKAAKEKNQPTAGDQGLQNVGGSERDVYDAAEWRNPALVQTLSQLERLRATDSPADLFALMHAGAKSKRAREQTW
jgi:Ca-activated chloride channel family protein